MRNSSTAIPDKPLESKERDYKPDTNRQNTDYTEPRIQTSDSGASKDLTGSPLIGPQRTLFSCVPWSSNRCQGSPNGPQTTPSVALTRALFAGATKRHSSDHCVVNILITCRLPNLHLQRTREVKKGGRTAISIPKIPSPPFDPPPPRDDGSPQGRLSPSDSSPPRGGWTPPQTTHLSAHMVHNSRPVTCLLLFVKYF